MLLTPFGNSLKFGHELQNEMVLQRESESLIQPELKQKKNRSVFLLNDLHCVEIQMAAFDTTVRQQ